MMTSLTKFINKNRLILMTGLLLASGNVFSQDKFDYKCYVKSTDDTESIRVQYARNVDEARMSLNGTFYIENDRQYQIRYVGECIIISDEDFTGVEARQISKQYPM
ncbi:MAG: hypothetical protein GY694_20850 [Gammaproteobacteria bacterium]|nr:hypothetical protein [Gammaproteobacteria bacterium]